MDKSQQLVCSLRGMDKFQGNSTDMEIFTFSSVSRLKEKICFPQGVKSFMFFKSSPFFFFFFFFSSLREVTSCLRKLSPFLK